MNAPTLSFPPPPEPPEPLKRFLRTWRKRQLAKVLAAICAAIGVNTEGDGSLIAYAIGLLIWLAEILASRRSEKARLTCHQCARRD